MRVPTNTPFTLTCFFEDPEVRNYVFWQRKDSNDGIPWITVGNSRIGWFYYDFFKKNFYHYSTESEAVMFVSFEVSINNVTKSNTIALIENEKSYESFNLSVGLRLRAFNSEPFE